MELVPASFWCANCNYTLDWNKAHICANNYEIAPCIPHAKGFVKFSKTEGGICQIKLIS